VETTEVIVNREKRNDQRVIFGIISSLTYAADREKPGAYRGIRTP
jgi:hypothetical protein